MNAEQYTEFHKYVSIMAHVWNTVSDSDTNINTNPDEDSLIALANLGLADTMRLNVQTRRLLNRTRYDHHIINRTWKGPSKPVMSLSF